MRGRKIKDITGQKFNMLTAVRCVGVKKNGEGRSEAIWEWKCDCGNIVTAQARHVKYKNMRFAKQSCGCWHKTKKNFGWKAVANMAYMRHYNNGDISLDEFIEMSQKPCYYCGAGPSNILVKKATGAVFCYNGLDRLDNQGPHNKSNCVACCWTCNERKSDWDSAKFLNWIRTIYERRVA